MTTILYIISVLWIAFGVFLVLYTETTRKTMKKIYGVKNPQWLALPAFVIGISLIISAFYFREMFRLVLVLGLLAVIKGLFFIITRPVYIKKFLDWWYEKASERTLRIFGMAIFFLGTILLSYLFFIIR
jgi:uncharacterized protein YjeT (DUF2065 family)